MNLSTPEFMFSRQRSRQWIPLITQQFRLRHLYQIIGFNLQSQTVGSYYFTLHSTTMCAPFYTSEQVNNPNPKWSELLLLDLPNTSASCIVLRIWQHNDKGADKIVLTWGVYFSGLVYIGNKIADIQATYFKANSVIFGIHGGYYTSLDAIRTNLSRPIPFINNVNVIDTASSKAIYKRIAIKCHKNEIQSSYSVDKLMKLQSLQLQIRNKRVEVQNVEDKINVLNGSLTNEREGSGESNSSLNSTTRYSSPLLTMNSLNKMLHEKPTKVQKQEMIRINKEIELAKFKTRLLHQERDRTRIAIRQLKQKYAMLQDKNEEKDSDLMENYHKLSRGTEKLKDYKKNIVHHKEIYSQLNVQLQQRRRKLLEELLFIYPIEKHDDKYRICGIYLPNSDIIADSSDNGVSVALGYVTHILIMCSTFLQVPLRYPLTHFGSRSFVTDNVSPLLPDRERDFPLFTRSKDKVQFTYAVYLLNKNMAQFRWLLSMNTNDLKATLSNLSQLLKGEKERTGGNKRELPPSNADKKISFFSVGPPNDDGGKHGVVGLRSFGSISNLSDPILDRLKQENRTKRATSPTRSGGGVVGDKKASFNGKEKLRSGESGRGLSEILAIPEAYLNKQISSASLRNYMAVDKSVEQGGSSCSTPPISSNGSADNLIKITTGKDIGTTTTTTTCDTSLSNIEQGTDPLDPKNSLTIGTRPITIRSDSQLVRRLKKVNDHHMTKQQKRISRSEGSYTDEEGGGGIGGVCVLRPAFDLGSEPSLNVAGSGDAAPEREAALGEAPPSSLDSSSSSPLVPCSAASSANDRSAPLMARTNALLNTKSFNLVRPKL